MSETNMGGADELRDLFRKAQDSKVIGKDTEGLLTGHLGHVVIAGAAGAALEDIMASDVTLVTILVDRSSSIGAHRLEDAVRGGQNALLDAFVGSKEHDSILVALWTFASSVSVLHSYVPARDATRLDGKNYRSSGSTVLYDVWCDALAANVAYAQKLRDGGTPSKSVVVVVTDGEDTGLKRTQAECARISRDLLASESFVLAFVGVGRDVSFRAVARGMGVPDGCIAEEKSATPSALRNVFQMVLWVRIAPLHASVRIAALDRDARLRLCKYVLRPPLAEAQLWRTFRCDVRFSETRVRISNEHRNPRSSSCGLEAALAPRVPDGRTYQRHEPEKTILHRVVREHFAALKELEREDEPSSGLPAFVVNEFTAFLDCGILSRGFIRLFCKLCRFERFVGFSCKTRTLCPSCAARRMHATAEQLVERVLPDVPIRQWVLSPPPELVALLGARPDALAAMNRSFSRAIERRLRRRAKEVGIEGKSGAVTFIQRFSSTLRLFPHLHSLVFDGVFEERGDEGLVFVPLSAPTRIELEQIGHEVATSLAKRLLKLGLVSDNEEAAASLTPVDRWYAKVTRDRDLFAELDEHGALEPAAQARRDYDASPHGFSIHASVRIAALDRDARLRLCKYVLRPPLAEAQLEQLDDGRLSFQLKAPTKSGATHIILEPLALLRRLAWLVPPPVRNQTVYAGVLAGSSKWRKQIVPRKLFESRPSLDHAVESHGSPCATRLAAPALIPSTDTRQSPSQAPGVDAAPAQPDDSRPLQKPSDRDDLDVDSILSQQTSVLSWAELLRRTYLIDALECERCGGRLTPIGIITDPKVAMKILEHLGMDSTTPRFAPARAPP